MVSQTFCYRDKQQSAGSYIIQFHASHTEVDETSIFPFLRLFLSFEMNFSTSRSRPD